MKLLGNYDKTLLAEDPAAADYRIKGAESGVIRILSSPVRFLFPPVPPS
jgi:hypothetical protein